MTLFRAQSVGVLYRYMRVAECLGRRHPRPATIDHPSTCGLWREGNYMEGIPALGGDVDGSSVGVMITDAPPL